MPIVSGYIYRWKADDLGLSNNDPIGSWADAVASIAASNTGTERPTFRTAITPTGKPVVRCDGIDDVLNSASSLSNVKHIFVVAAFRPGSANGEGLVSIGGGGYFWAMETSLNFQYASSFGTARRNGVNTSAVYGNGQFAVYSILLNSATSGSICIGGDRDISGREGAWDICEIVIYSSELNSSQIAQNEAALDQYWITPLPPTITTTSLPSGTVNTPYSQQLQATGGSGSLAWSEVGTVSGLPPGLSINSAGLISGTPTQTGTFNFTVEVEDSLTQTDDQALTIVIEAQIIPESKWTKMRLVPLSDLEAWHNLDNSTDGTIIKDYSGKFRDVICASNAPALQTNIRNGLPGLYFDGTKNPLSYTGNLTARHIFIVASFADATFSGNEGLMSDLATNAILLGQNAAATVFFNVGYTSSGYTYRKDDVVLAESNQKAPVSGKFAIIELQFPGGLALDGIRYGQDRGFTTRKWKGHFLECLIYSQIKTIGARYNIYRYFAMKYLLWRRKSDDLYVCPFHFDRSTQLDSIDDAELSEAEGNRGRDRVVRYLSDDELVRYGLSFLTRPALELKAMRAFCREHRLHLPFWLEDIEREDERKVIRDSEISVKGSGTFLHDYQLAVKDY